MRLGSSPISRLPRMFLFAVFMMWVSIASGQGGPSVRLKPPITQGGTDLEEFIELLITIMQSIIMPVTVVALIYGGYLLVTAGDNEADRSKAKRWIIWSIVGATIVIGAQLIADIIQDTVSDISP